VLSRLFRVQTAASIPLRLAALILVVGGTPLIDDASGGGRLALGLGLCVLFGAAVGRYAAAFVPIVLLSVMATVNYANAEEQIGVASGIFFVALLCGVGAGGVIFGVALHKALRQAPSTA
jgi:hypothetical protein